MDGYKSVIDPKEKQLMARAIGIGTQDFDKIRVNNNFYIDKTDFIHEWWDSGDEVTLITRPRRFGKTLNMSMADRGRQVKDWYDGFSFGERKDIYNPWSIINLLDKKEIGTYWKLRLKQQGGRYI